MSDAIAEFFKFVGDLNAKKVAGSVFFLGLIVTALWVFEKQSSWLVLTKLERAQKLVADITTVERAGVLSPETQEAERKIKFHVANILSGIETSSSAGGALMVENTLVTKNNLAVVLAGAAPWFLCGIVFLFKRPKDYSIGSAFLGLVVLGAFSGLVNVVLPTSTALTEYFVFPIGIFLATGGVTIFVSAAAAVRKTAQRKAIQNNLRQLSAALFQYALEKAVTEVSYDELVGPDKYLKQVVSVAGEDYRKLPLKIGEPVWRVTTKDGEVVELEFNAAVGVDF